MTILRTVRRSSARFGAGTPTVTGATLHITALAAIVALAACGDGGGDELVSINVDAGPADGAAADGNASSSGATDTGTASSSSSGASDTATSSSSGAQDVGTSGSSGSSGGDDAGATSSSGGDDGGTSSSSGGDDAGSTSSSGGDDGGGSSSSSGGDDAGGSSSSGGDGGSTDPDASTAPAGKLCNPCSASTECTTDADKDAACVDQGGAGAFCGASCKDASDCAEGYACTDATSIEGLATKQCTRTKLAGECPCSKAAIDAAMSTACFAVDPSGKVSGQCPGTRSCTPKGLSECSAKPPAAEVCDGADNDCNGKVDDSTCDDGNPCTTDSCGGKDGCKHEAVTSACNDGSVCTEKDACKDGKCAGEAITCDDGNACTKDACDMATGCTATHQDGDCEDGNGCTEKDSCKNSACAAGSPKDCDDKDACTVDSCDPKEGKCVHKGGAGDACDDGDACTSNDVCDAGKCAGKAVTCDDGNPCTTDSCDTKDGCLHKAHSDACDDNNACTEKDVCDGGKCAGTDKVCDDGNACTDDGCDPQSGCTAKANTANCDDGSKCTEKDGCKDGKCTGADIVCDDSNPCTNDGCDMAKGCTTSDNDDVCSDDDACTKGDKCQGGACKGEAVKCDDGNSCTDDSCDKKDGCKNAANTASCDDGNACTEKDACKDSSCGAGPLKSCDDNNACTADSCSPSTGKCNHKVIAGCKGCTEDKECDDGNPCVTNKCVGKKCENTTLADDTKCDDGNFCTVGDVCKKGLCFPGKANECDDSNPCTNDLCDTKNSKCTHTSLAAKSKCGEKVAITEYKCINSAVYVRYAYPGCNGDQVKPICGTDQATLHWTELKKVQDCKLPNICHIEDGKGVCGPPKVPDLVISSLKMDKTTYEAGSTIKLAWEVTNKGNGEAGPSYMNFYTSQSASMTPGQYSKGGITLPKIAAGQTIKGVRDVYLQSAWTKRTLYVGAMVDRFAKVPESNEDNNGASLKFTVTPAVDLIPHSASKPNLYHHGWGASGTYTWYVYNAGVATSGKSTVKLFYSEDGKLDKNDIELGSAAVGAVKYKQSIKGTINYKMPVGNAKPGTRYLLMVVDAKAEVEEGNEANNMRAYKIAYYGYHDLVASKVETAPTVLQQGTLKLTITAKQAGNATSGTFYDRVYASKDTTVGKGDLLLATYTRKSIPAGGAYGGTATISLYKQTKFTEGDWYLIYVTDQTNTHKEVDEKNNVATVKVKVVSMPNVRPYHLSGHTTAYQGDLKYFTSYDRNYGTKATGAYKIRHYLSTDDKLDKDDKVLKTQSVSNVTPNGTYKVVSAWSIPVDQKVGTYYVIVHSDYEDKVKESNESDNTRTFKFTIVGRPDLVVASLSASSTNVTAGDTITIKAVTRNIGSAKTGTFNDRMYYAHAPTTHSTYLKKTFGQPALDGGASAKVSEHKLTIPLGSDTRTYYVTYYADAFGGVKESNEKNNTRVLAIKVKGLPELKSYQFQPKGTSFKAGNTVTLYGGVRNYGKGTAGKFRVGYYLSTDNVFSKDDTLLKTVTRTGLAINQATSVHANVVLDGGLKSGTYYVIQVVDDQSEVYESDEKNNVRTYKITVAGAPDLVAKSITLKTDPVKAGNYLEGEVEHANVGAVSTGKGFTASFYISKDQKLGSDILQSTTTFIALGAGKSEKATFKFALNAAVKAGTWYMYYYVDSGKAISEGNEDNNIKWIKLDVK